MTEVTQENDQSVDKCQPSSESKSSLNNKSGIDLSTHAVDESLLKPLWIATVIAKYPCAVCWIVFIIMIIMAYLDALVFEYADNSERTWLVEDSQYTQDYDAWTLAQDARINGESSDANSDSSDSDSDSLPQTEEQGYWTVFMMFELESDKFYTSLDNDNNTWILTPENMETIIKYENMVIEDSKWKNYYCYVTDTSTYQCSYFSLAYMIYEHFNYSFDIMTTNDIKNYVLSLHNNEIYEATIEASFNSEFATNTDTHTPTYLYRSFLTSGNPIPTNITYYGKNDSNIIKKSIYSNGDDNYDKQETIYENDFALDLWIDITVNHESYLKDGNLRVVTLIWAAYDAYAWLLVDAAFLYIGFAMIAVLLWMTFHLQSIFLSIFGVCGIMLSFPFAYFIYYYIYDIGYFDLLSSLIIFVLLGVGADDVFVFTDAWHQSIHFVKNKNNNDNIIERMTFAYRRASKAMLVTQITTFFAFLATAFSRLLPIAAFGIWAATIVATDYFLVITMYPAIIIIHHKYIKKYESKYLCCCCYYKNIENIKNNCCCQKNDKNSKNDKNRSNDTDANANATTNSIELASKTDLTQMKTDESNDDNNDEDGAPPALARQLSVEEQAAEYRAVERFFGLKWAQMILKIKYYVLVVFAIIFGIHVYFATGLEALDESETWFAEDHYLQQVLYLVQDFSVSEEDGLIDVTVIWGVSGVDRGDSSYWDPEEYGSIEWDNTFDMSSYDSQLFMYQVCLNLSESDLVYQKSSVICTVNQFANWTISQGYSFPWIYSDYMDDNNNNNFNDTITMDETYYNETIQKLKFAELMYNFSLSSKASDVNANNLLYVKTPEQTGIENEYYIQYIAIFAYIDLSWDSTGEESRTRRNLWFNWMDDTFYNNENCPDYVCKPIQASSMWAWLVSQSEFVRSALQGIAIAMPIAFIVLIISTHNWIIAIFATLDIIGIMACVLGLIDLYQWQFGISESISIVIIIGFSVDYVVHLANAYLESISQTKQERLSFSLLTMGVSVVSGAVTTFLSGFFMQFPEMQFFYKMGVIILATIIWSILWAMFFFTSLLAAFGPQGKTGNIPFDKFHAFCKNKFNKMKGNQ